MRVHIRLVVCVCLAVFSIFSIILLLPSARVRTRLQRIALGVEAGGLTGLWAWGKGDASRGRRLVVFGDSWADNTMDDGEGGKGRSWTEVLCDEIKCISYMNFGASQPSRSYPASPPTGAQTTNRIPTSSTAQSGDPGSNLLPDLAAQIREFISLPQSKNGSSEMIFIISFGIWDIYHYADLDFATSQSIIETTITELFNQLDILLAYVTKSSSNPDSSNSTAVATATPPPFHVILPKLFDPSLLPGWISQRAPPLPPSSIAERQKNAMYLTTLWNSILENKIGEWLLHAPVPSMPAAGGGLLREAAKHGDVQPEEPEALDKDVFYYDLPRYLLNILIQHQLEDAGLSDASGLGMGTSPFESVSQPCVREAADEADDGDVDGNGRFMCRDPKEYLFWDGFNLGAVANEGIGKEVGAMVMGGKSMRTILKEGKPKGG